MRLTKQRSEEYGLAVVVELVEHPHERSVDLSFAVSFGVTQFLASDVIVARPDGVTFSCPADIKSPTPAASEFFCQRVWGGRALSAVVFRFFCHESGYSQKVLSADDCFVAFGCIVLVKLAVVLMLGERESISLECFLEESVAHVLLVGEDVLDGQGMPFVISVPLGDVPLAEITDDFSQRPAREVGLEYPADGFGFRLEDDELLVLVAVAIGGGTCYIFATLHSLTVHVLQPLRNCHGFFLCDGTEGGQHQLIAHAESVDAVFLENDADALSAEGAGIFQTFGNISGEAGYGLGDDQVDPLMLAQPNHLLEFGSLVCSCACDTLVSEDIHEFPIRTGLDGLGVVPHLSGIGVELVSRIGGNTAVSAGSEFFACIRIAHCFDSLDYRHGVLLLSTVLSQHYHTLGI